MKTILAKTIYLAMFTGLLTGCGGGGGSDSPSQTSGNFRDANVVGLEYQSGSNEPSVTGTNGSYICNNGENVRFFLGNVNFGSALCKSLITPIDLVENGDVTNPEVLNIVRFLNYIDDGSDNEITISEDVRTKFNTELSTNLMTFNTTTFTIPTEISSLSGFETKTLPTVASATAHITRSLRCAYGGIFTGLSELEIVINNQSFKRSNKTGIMIDPITGTFEGLSYVQDDDTLTGEYDELVSSIAFSLDNNRKAIYSNSYKGTMSGVSMDLTENGYLEMPTVNNVNGNIDIRGTAEYNGQFMNVSGKLILNTTRIGNMTDAKHRVVGKYTSANDLFNGYYAVDIDANNSVTGYMYDPDGTINTVAVSGSITDSTLTATIRDNLENVSATITATVDLNAGTLSNGTWSSIDGYNGTLTGKMCQLN